MKNLSIPALLLVGALALAGCSAGTGDAPAALKAAHVNVKTGADVKPVDSKQEWADEKVSQFLSGQGARSFGAFAGEATGSIESWHSPKIGHLVIEVSGKGWEWDSDLLDISRSFMAGVGYESPELINVEVIAPNSDAVGTYGRADMTNANPWTM